MDGMEKITARIQEDADREIAAMNAQTDEQIAALQAQARAQAEQERADDPRPGRAGGGGAPGAPEIGGPDGAAEAGAGRQAGGPVRGL